MASVAETAWAELLTRLQAAPAYGGVAAGNIRRAHKTNVTRANAPAVHLIEGRAKPTADKSCWWRWEMEGTISVYVRDDLGNAAADPLVIEVVNRINPEIATAYSNKVLLELTAIAPDTEIADEDAVRVDIDIVWKYSTGRWSLDTPAS